MSSESEQGPTSADGTNRSATRLITRRSRVQIPPPPPTRKPWPQRRIVCARSSHGRGVSLLVKHLSNIARRADNPTANGVHAAFVVSGATTQVLRDGRLSLIVCRGCSCTAFPRRR